jgi:hypothetical protein
VTRHLQSEKSLPAAACLLRGDFQLGGNVLILSSCSRQQNDAGAPDQDELTTTAHGRIAPNPLAVQKSGESVEQRAAEKPLYSRDVVPGKIITGYDAYH